MALSNFERMIQLAEEIFDVKNDPRQIQINPGVLAHLQKLHPATVCEYDDGHGPVAWVLLIPTTAELMNRFLKSEISEQELLDMTPIKAKYEALYLCSAMVLEEYRRKGIAGKLTLEAVEKIRKDHPLKALFVWTFSKEGLLGSEALARMTGLPLYKKIENAPLTT